MPRLQKPESTRVHANADASTLSLRWVATCDECAGAPDTRPAHPNTANLSFSTTVENPLPCILNSASAQSPGDPEIRLRADPGQLPGCVYPHYTSEKSLATTWHLAAQLVTSQGLLPPKSPRENRLVLP